MLPRRGRHLGGGDIFAGTVKVKLGPISLMYSGTGTFLERDESTGRLVVEAKGKDKRGNGTAGAKVTATIADAGDGQTSVDVLTDLQITGKPAQFGRGVIQDVSDRLLQQFVTCLQSKVGAEPAEVPAEAVPETAGSDAAEPAVTAETTALEAAAVPEDDALDLGTTVIPILLKSYRKQVAGGVAALLVLLLLWRLVKRR